MEEQGVGSTDAGGHRHECPSTPHTLSPLSPSLPLCTPCPPSFLHPLLSPQSALGGFNRAQWQQQLGPLLKLWEQLMQNASAVRAAIKVRGGAWLRGEGGICGVVKGGSGAGAERGASHFLRAPGISSLKCKHSPSLVLVRRRSTRPAGAPLRALTPSRTLFSW